MFFDSDDEDEFEEFLLRTIRLGVSDEDVRDSADAKIERFDDEAFVKLFEDDHIAKHVFKYFTAQAQARFRLVNSHCYHLLQSNDSSNDGMWLFLLEQHTAVANTCRKILYDPPAKKDYHPMFHSAANIYRVAYTFSKRRNKCALCYQNLLPHSLFSFLTSSHDRRGISSRYCNKCVGTRVMPFAQAADMYYLSLSESSKFWINGYSSFIEEREILNYFSKEFPDVDELQRRQTNYENQYLKTIRNKNAVETQYRKKLEQIMVEKGLDPVEAHSTALAAKFFSNKLRNDPEVNGEDIAKETLRRREMISLFKETVKSFMSPNSEFVITDSHLHSVSGITRSYISSQIEANDADNLEVAKAEIVRYAKQILGKDGPTSGTTNLEEHDKRLQQMTNGEFTLQTMQQCQYTYEHFFSMCKYGVKVSDEKMQEAIKAAKREMRIEQELKENNYNMKYMELPNSVINYIRFCVMSRRKTTSTFYQVISKILRTYANLTNNSKLLHSCMNKLDTAGKLDVVIFSLKCRTNCVLKAGDPQPTTSSDNAMTDDNGATIPPIAVEETKDENTLAFIEELSNLLDKYKTTNSNVPKELLDTIAASLFKPIADDSYFYPRSLVINYFIENYVRVRGSNGALKSYGVDQPEAAEVVDEIVIEPESESESEPEPEPEPERLNRRKKREYDEAEYHLNRKEQNEFEKLPDDEGIARSRPQRKRRKFSETSKNV